MKIEGHWHLSRCPEYGISDQKLRVKLGEAHDLFVQKSVQQQKGQKEQRGTAEARRGA